MPSITAINEVKEKAQNDFFHQRVAKLSFTFFPDSAIHDEFQDMLIKLLKFNNAKQMGIHLKTWENMCNKTREFFLPEIEVCFEILERANPHELVDQQTVTYLTDHLENNLNKFLLDEEGKIKPMSLDKAILYHYNNVSFPKIKEILKPMRDIYNRIDKAISIPLANKINSDCKISLQLPIGSQINFVALPNHG